MGYCIITVSKLIVIDEPILFSETCNNDYVLFQAASTIKEAVVREWTLLQPNDVESLRTYLLHYVTQNMR